MGIVNNVLAGASGNQGYLLSRSLRFRASASAYLSRTFTSTGNRKTWTWSGWLKRGLGSATDDRMLFSGTVNGTSTVGGLFFNGGGESLRYIDITSPATFQSNVTVTPVYRDFSAWYHIVLAVDTTQATASNRIRFFVNGVEVTAFSSTTYPSQNADTFINTAQQHRIGSYPYQTIGLLDGYLTEINFIDGQALTPSSFGMNDPLTGVWEPKKYTGTYGTNGFYLPFTDNSNNTATTIGKDFSGNGNNWTPNNISVTAGVTYDSMTDVPTLTSATAANYATLNPLQTGSYVTASNANLTLTGNTSTNSAISSGTISFTSGKYYYEYTQGTVQSETCGFALVPITGSLIDGETFADSRSGGFGARASGSTYGAAKIASSLTSWTNGDVVGIAIDADNGAAYWSKNGVWQTSGVPTSGASKTGAVAGWTPTSSTIVTPFFGAYNTGFININFGQRPFAYTPPTGFVALNTFNLPTPTIGATPTTQANKYFNATLYTGTGSSQNITNSGSMQPDLVWGKSRSNAYNNSLIDSVRGVSRSLQSNLTNAEDFSAGAYVTAFNSDGFTVGTGTANNGSGATYVAWQWRASNATGVTNTAGSITSTVSANTTAGFSIVTWTGAGSSGTIGHGLGVAPNFIILKRRNAAVNWYVGGSNIASAGNGTWSSVLEGLNTTAAINTGATAVFNSTAPTSTVFTGGSELTANGGTYVAYCFAEVAGYSRFGSYTGNGSADGPFIFTGFRPRFLLLKCSSSSDNWSINDSARDPYNAWNARLYPDLSNAENAGGAGDFLSNGFKLRSASQNTNGATYIYMAFAENPFKYSLAR